MSSSSNSSASRHPLEDDDDDHTFDLGGVATFGAGSGGVAGHTFDFCGHCRTKAETNGNAVPCKEKTCPGFKGNRTLRANGSDPSPLMRSRSSSTSSTNDEEMATLNHCHAHSLAEAALRQRHVAAVRRKLILATCFCLLFAAGEAVGGYLSQSLAIMSDAAHMLSDFANLVIGVIAVFVGGKTPGRKYNYGLLRAEALGALFSIILIWNMAGWIFINSVQRLVHNDFEIQSTAMLIAGGCAVAFNIFMVIFLNGIPHSHSHFGHSHFTNPTEDGLHTPDTSHGHSHSSRHHLNVRAALVHAVGDVLQSTGVFIISIIIKFYPTLKILDPICSIVFCLIVLYTTVFVVRDTVKILMEGAPRNIKYDEVLAELQSVGGVVSVHDLRIWSLTADKLAVSAHLTVNVKSGRGKEMVLQEGTKVLRDRFHVSISTLQVESFIPQIMDTCDQCKPLE